MCCSAGAGRTGTFIALSNILERVKAEGLLDVFQTVKSLRMQRPHMVQTVVSISRSESNMGGGGGERNLFLDSSQYSFEMLCLIA